MFENRKISIDGRSAVNRRYKLVTRVVLTLVLFIKLTDVADLQAIYSVLIL